MKQLINVATAVVNNPAFASKDITGDGRAETFCNWATQLIANAVFDYAGFDGKTANQIDEFVRGGNGWIEVTNEQAATLAQTRPVIASQSAAGNGHVCFVLPLPPVQSGSWKKRAPMVANVGRKNGIFGANFAFQKEPKYYSLQ